MCIRDRSLAHTIIAIIIGNGLNAAGLKLEFSIEYMPILLLSSAMLITVSIQLAECIRFYRNFEKVIKRTNIIVIGIIESMVLLLSIMGRLEIIELLVAVVGKDVYKRQVSVYPCKALCDCLFCLRSLRPRYLASILLWPVFWLPVHRIRAVFCKKKREIKRDNRSCGLFPFHGDGIYGSFCFPG